VAGAAFHFFAPLGAWHRLRRLSWATLLLACFGGFDFAHRSPVEFEAVGVVDDAIQMLNAPIPD
jgi:hypothetical protein